MEIKKKKRRKGEVIRSVIINLFFALFSLMFIYPILMIIAVSFTGEKEIMELGYHLIPKKIDLTAYKFVLNNPTQIINSYKTTIFFTLAGTVLSMAVMTMLAYTIAQEKYKLRKLVSFMIFFTMLFSGGLVPAYIMNTQYLHLGNTIWIYILPSLASAFQIIILRTFFKGLPIAIAESARVDGANEFVVFFRIILPMSKPVLATVAVMNILNRWNDWYTSMIYIKDPALFSLQYNLQKTLLELQFILDNYNKLPPGIDLTEYASVPTEGVRMATCVIVALPVLVVFPFFQKYFAQGITVGAVKG